MSATADCLERDNRQCFRCGEAVDPMPFKSVHHRLLRSAGRQDTLDNLITLCGSGTTGCHGRAHASPRWARAEGLLVSRYATPAEVPVRHWDRGWVYLTADGRITDKAAPHG